MMRYMVEIDEIIEIFWNKFHKHTTSRVELEVQHRESEGLQDGEGWVNLQQVLVLVPLAEIDQWRVGALRGHHEAALNWDVEQLVLEVVGDVAPLVRVCFYL